MTLSKKVVIIAGPNGAGKSTFAREFLPQESLCSAFINADMIAAGLSPFAPDKAAIQAGRLMLRAIQEHAARGNSFALETTLSGLSYARSIPRWQAAGYVGQTGFLGIAQRASGHQPCGGACGAGRAQHSSGHHSAAV
jgi:predicted ABC-type ATPase